MTIAKFLNLTTASPCSSQNHIAMTVSYVPVFLLSDFSFLLILRPPFIRLTVPIVAVYTCPINPGHIPSYGAAVTAAIFYFYVGRKEAEGRAAGQCLQSLQ